MLHYLLGDATHPVKSPAIISHVVNDQGRWGSGFVLAVSKEDPKPQASYHKWFKNTNGNLPLGAVQIIGFKDNHKIANMVAQHGVKPKFGRPPIRYRALEHALKNVYKTAYKDRKWTVHMPRIGAARAGGDWKKIEKIIKSCIADYPVETFIYTLPSESDQWTEKYENE